MAGGKKGDYAASGIVAVVSLIRAEICESRVGLLLPAAVRRAGLPWPLSACSLFPFLFFPSCSATTHLVTRSDAVTQSRRFQALLSMGSGPDGLLRDPPHEGPGLAGLAALPGCLDVASLFEMRHASRASATCPSLSPLSLQITGPCWKCITSRWTPAAEENKINSETRGKCFRN